MKQPAYSRDRALKRLKILGIIIAFLLAGNIGYHVWQRYYQLKTPQTVSREPCDLHKKACTVYMPEGKSVRLNIKPKTIPADQTLQLDVHLEKIDAQNVHLSIIPLDNKEIQSTHLSLKKLRSGHYRHEGQLNVTNHENVHWLAIVIIETDENGSNIAIPYKFDSLPD